MANLERTYIIPMRKNFIKRAKYKRAKRAVNIVREFLGRHMKSSDIKLGNMINRELWKRGIKNPPGKIKVVAIKDDKGIVKAELFGHKYVDKVKVEKVEKSKLEQLKEKMLGKEEAKKDDTAKEHNKEAIEHIHEHEHPHDHGAHQQSEKNLHAEEKKERKVSSGKAKSKDNR